MLAMLVSGCAATQPEASIAQSGIVGCADQAVWGSVVAVTDGRATIRTERWLIPATGAATVEAAVDGPVGSHGLLVLSSTEDPAFYSDEAGLEAENAWEADGRPHDPPCDDNPRG
jgi:hypothetical protein